MAGCRAQAIDGSVPRDRQQPGGQRATRWIEALRAVPQGEERVLDDFRGDPAIATDTQGGREDRRGVSVVEACERVLGTIDELASSAQS